MSNIADIGFKADTSELKDAQTSLRALVPAAAAAEKASDKLAREMDNTATAAGRMASGAAAASAAVDKTVTGTNSAAAAAGKAASANDKLASSVKAVAAGLRDQGSATVIASGQLQQYDAHIMAFHASNNRVKDGLNETSKAIKFTAYESLNASRQLADIGVTLAGGMSPFMVAMQQGPQLLDILQNKAAATGNTLGAVFKAAGAAILTAIAPILPIIAGIAIVAGTVAAGFALATRSINDNSKSIADGMDLTEKQLEKVKKAGVDTSVTIGDTFKATFEVLGERFTSAFEKPIKATSKLIGEVFDIWTAWGANTIRAIVGAFTAGYYGIVALWKNMPKTFAGIGALIGNAFINVFETLINRALEQINGINSKINELLSAVGIGFQLQAIAPVKLGRIVNAEAKATADAVSKGMNEGYKAGVAATDRFFGDVRKKARSNRQKIIQEAAGDAEKGKDPKKAKDAKDPLDRLGIQRVYDDPFGQKDIDAFNKDTAMPSQLGKLTNIDGLDVMFAKYREQVDFAKDATKGFIDDLRGNLDAGKGLFASFTSAVTSSLNKIFDKLLDKTLNAALEGLFGGNGGGFLGSLFGSVGKTSAPAKFAKGDVFGSPTAFSYGRGKTGIMGEAGAEAVMPLKRGADGSLGVQMHGGSEGGSTFAPSVAVNNYYTLSGAMSTAEVTRAIRQSGDQVKQDVRKSIPAVLQEYQMNGTIA